MSKPKAGTRSTLTVPIIVIIVLTLLSIGLMIWISALTFEQRKLSWLMNGSVLTEQLADPKKPLGLIYQQDQLTLSFMKHFKAPEGLKLTNGHRTTLRDAGAEFVKPQVRYVYAMSDNKADTHAKLVAALKQGGFTVEPYDDAEYTRVMGWNGDIRMSILIDRMDSSTTIITVERDK